MWLHNFVQNSHWKPPETLGQESKMKRKWIKKKKKEKRYMIKDFTQERKLYQYAELTK